MFTGLVQHVGRVLAVEPTPAGKRLTIDPAGWDHRPSPGDSICIAGCCLTVVATGVGAHGAGWAFDAVPETLSKTTLGGLSPDSGVNLEHAATPTTLLGGHVVQGHVDGTGVVSRVQDGADWRVEVRVPADLMPFMIPKGSVCLEGVSLTLANVDPAASTIEVALIPVTLARTTLGTLMPGDRVNIEADAMVKAVVHVLRHFTNPATADCLAALSPPPPQF